MLKNKSVAAFTAAILCASAITPLHAQSTPAAAPVASQAKADPALERRVGELPGIISGTTDLTTFFTADFLTRVPPARFKATNEQMLKSLGAVQSVRLVSAETPFSGVAEVTFEKTKTNMRITVDPAAPHLVTGLRPMGAVSGESSMGAVIGALRSLPGETALTITRLEDSGPAPMLNVFGDRVMAIGSEFKLIVLAELVRAVNAGERKWDDQVAIGDDLPRGFYTDKPADTKVTLRELADRMISVSDNSATDILMKALGREKVEAMMPVVGIADPSRNKPFLLTMEANKLKGKSERNYGQLYGTLDEAGKRALLAGDIARARAGTAAQAAAARGAPLAAASSTQTAAAPKPNLIDTVEWFASPMDMARVMNWLRQNTENGPAAEARAILSKNRGLPLDIAEKMNFVGFKGGSEAGVIAATYLLQDKTGRWFAVSASWNNKEAAVENERFMGLVARAIELVIAR